MFGKLALAALGFSAIASAAPAVEPADRAAAAAAAVADKYVFYKGDGSTGAGWPGQDKWGSYSQLWSANVPLMKKSCGWNGWGADNSDAEINAIGNAIQQISQQTGVDNRFILAVIMQESKGCVRVPTTNNGVVNPGLMQSHNGSGSCAGKNPCPNSQITQMVKDGTAGTSAGAGLQQLIKQAASATGNTGSRSFYGAARLYNSGSADYGNLNNGLGSTACYASDVANRLTGWTLAASNCRA
ncbi:hypothetical protein PT974_03016 [Cladobotryum mycophilum]|uniref:Muramidase n=1 Tax=Cladobotryum mycophilum TaxID=491253 RepID=A0ABR0SVX0_9HYPO